MKNQSLRALRDLISDACDDHYLFRLKMLYQSCYPTREQVNNLEREIQDLREKYGKQAKALVMIKGEAIRRSPNEPIQEVSERISGLIQEVLGLETKTTGSGLALVHCPVLLNLEYGGTWVTQILFGRQKLNDVSDTRELLTQVWKYSI